MLDPTVNRNAQQQLEARHAQLQRQTRDKGENNLENREICRK